MRSIDLTEIISCFDMRYVDLTYEHPDYFADDYSPSLPSFTGLILYRV